MLVEGSWTEMLSFSININIMLDSTQPHRLPSFDECTNFHSFLGGLYLISVAILSCCVSPNEAFGTDPESFPLILTNLSL
ncbi:hypothetical protein Y032_0274g1007 [Ancylostoma ceylanicum]|uniref:Uncharacterized protein n=1 Tax=Ancylostoma ceylanicum TaxID=53326 RepID=A0A016S8U9_9BILA|nr:hypothetical protein Y032_0274g1007 [Ancylostoma ceylanicum]